MIPAHFDDRLAGVVTRLGELSGWIPAQVPLGYHLCYGDAPSAEGEGRDLEEPEDTSKLVAVASAVTERAARPLAWFSMPVPLSRATMTRT